MCENILLFATTSMAAAAAAEPIGQPAEPGRRHRAWVFTVNNPAIASAADCSPKAQADAMWALCKGVYMVTQMERVDHDGQPGTPHLQGYVILMNPKGLSGVKKIHATAHWEVRRGTHEQVVA